MKTRHLCLVVLAVTHIVSNAYSRVNPLSEEVQRIFSEMGSPRGTVNPQLIAQLKEEDRQTIIQFYRIELENLTAKDARKGSSILVPEIEEYLLRFGDPQITATLVETFWESPAGEARTKAAADLLKTGRAEVIPMLAPAIMEDEPFKVEPMRGDVGSPLPLTYAVANSILGIVAKSPRFNADVRKWAAENQNVDPQKIKGMMRKWWKENESLLRAEKFNSVKAGEDLRTAELAEKKTLEERRWKYRENLIAQGKSPADLENWKGWAAANTSPSAIDSPKSQEQSPNQSKPSQLPSAIAVSSPSSLYLWIGGSAVFAVLAILWARLRKQSR